MSVAVDGDVGEMTPDDGDGDEVAAADGGERATADGDRGVDFSDREW